MEMRTPSDVFKQLEDIPFNVSPYLKTRVLADLADRKQKSLQARRWKWIAIASVSVTAMFVLMVAVPFDRTFVGRVGEAMVVRIDVASIKSHAVAEVEVELPEGVYFYSEEHPEFNQTKHLKIQWSRIPKSESERHFPFIIRSREAGQKTVFVKFYDKRKILLSQKTIQLKFANPGDEG